MNDRYDQFLYKKMIVSILLIFLVVIMLALGMRAQISESGHGTVRFNQNKSVRLFSKETGEILGHGTRRV